jgi:putative oxidoreductase
MPLSESHPLRRLATLVGHLDAGVARLPPTLVGLALRVALAVPFFRSGLTKWEAPFQLSGGAKFLFREEFRLHLFGAEIPYPAPDLMAFASGTAEIVLPILLVLGLATRFAALGLLAMTAVIQLTVPDGWEAYHLPWAAMAGALMIVGPGRLALDAVLARLFAQPSRPVTTTGGASAQGADAAAPRRMPATM